MSNEIRYELEVVKWQGSIHCAYLNNLRIAGGKPWAGGQIVKKWSVTARDVIQSIPELQNLSKNYETAQSELAALREELAKWQGIAGRRTAERTEFMNERDDLQQRLTAAEQRNSELDGLYKCAIKMVTDHSVRASELEVLLMNTTEVLRSGGGYGWEDAQADIIDAALQPTESGASE